MLCLPHNVVGSNRFDSLVRGVVEFCKAASTVANKVHRSPVWEQTGASATLTLINGP